VRTLGHKVLSQALVSARRAGLDGAQGHAGPLGYFSLGEVPKKGKLYHLSVRSIKHL
jgi:hypothetical protein